MGADDAKRIRELEAELANLRSSQAEPAAPGTKPDSDSAEENGEHDGEPAEEKGKPKLSVRAWVLIAVVVVVVAGIVIAVVAQSNRQSPAQKLLETAYDTCAVNTTGLQLTDGGSTLVFDHKGEKDTSGASIEEIGCVLMMLDVPHSILSHMDQTTSLDGRQDEQWGDFRIQWSYHPDRGLDGVITEVAD